MTPRYAVWQNAQQLPLFLQGEPPQKETLAGFLAGLAWLLAGLVWLLAGFWLGFGYQKKIWLAFWLAFWLVWFGSWLAFWLVWLGSPFFSLFF